MKEIKLGSTKRAKHKEFVAMVDDDDFERVNSFKWSVQIRKLKSKCMYAVCSINSEKKIYMHRFILNPLPKQVVDHKDGNGLNNQKNNLRACTQSENLKNRTTYGSSKYLGVHLRKQIRKYVSRKTGETNIYTSEYWVASIRINGIINYLGIFKKEEEAALAYNKSAEIHHGEYARLNII